MACKKGAVHTQRRHLGFGDEFPLIRHAPQFTALAEIMLHGLGLLTAVDVEAW